MSSPWERGRPARIDSNVGGTSAPGIVALALLLVLGLFGCVRVSSLDRGSSPPLPTPWPHENSDLTPDPAVVWGRLENGLRYAILPHETPRARTSVYLLVQAGSHHERSSELGFAHFVEHMAFRDMLGFGPDGATQALQRLGVSSGAHVNATTSPFETAYHLNNLPSDDLESLPLGLKIFRAVADGVLFDQQTVEQERGVIFSEQRLRLGMLATARPDELEFLAPRSETLRWTELLAVFGNTRLTKRHPFGTDRTMLAATPGKLRAFYERWYRPERMILAIVGDVTPSRAEELIRENFSTLAGRGRPPAEIAFEPGKPIGSSPRVFWDAVESEPALHLTLGTPASPRALPDSVARRRESLVRNIALAMLNRRLERVAESVEAPFTSASSYIAHHVPGHEFTLLRAAVPPARWSKALAALGTEVRRASTLGFTDAELTDSIKRRSIRLLAMVRQARAQTSAEVAATLAFAVARDVVFTAANEDRRLTEAQLTTLTVGECTSALHTLLPAGKLAVAMLGPYDKSDRRMIAAALTESAKAPLAAYVAPAPPRPFPYTDFGPPGEIVKNDHSTTLDADLIRFANGVGLNLKQTDYEPGRVQMMIRFGAGRLGSPVDQPGLDWRIFAWILGGLRDLSADDERAALAEIAGSFSMSSSDDDFRIIVQVSPEHLLLACQNSAAYFVHPAFRETDFPRSLEIARQVIAPFTVTAGGVAQATLAYHMSSQHPADHPPNMAEVTARTLDELKAWLLPQLATGPLEISVIGDFDRTQVIDTVARTFGALPPRSADDPYASQRHMTFPPKPFSETVTFDGPKSVAIVTLAWPAPEIVLFSERLRGHIMADILADRLRQKLRDEMGESYAPSAGFTWHDAYTPSPAFLRCSVEAAPERVEHVAAAMRAVVETLVRDGATAEEFERTRRPRVRDTESNVRDNTWWLDAIGVAQSLPVYAEGWAGALEDYRGATLDEINSIARRVLQKDRECKLIVVPSGTTPAEKK